MMREAAGHLTKNGSVEGVAGSGLLEVDGVPFQNARLHQSFDPERVFGDEALGILAGREDAHRTRCGIRRLERAQGYKFAACLAEVLVLGLVAGKRFEDA